MLAKVAFCAVFALFSLCSSVHSTAVQFTNRCGHHVEVIRTGNGQPSAVECSLGSGGSCRRDYGGGAMNFKNGWGGQTLAEFSFNGWNSLDFYDLSVIVGYDTAMRISSDNGGVTVTCTHAGCPDAYLYPTDDTKTRSTRTGGTFNVDFCP